MDLEVGDEIEVARNHWDGYSKESNLRTKKTLLNNSNILNYITIIT